jgi:hypothetical protein
MVSNLIVGPHCVCYINSIPFARAASVTVDISTSRKPIKGIDVLQATELIPVEQLVNGGLSVFRLHRDGGIEAAGLIGTWNSMTREKYFSLMIIDRATDTVVIQADKCSVQRQSWTYQPKAYVMGTITWTGIVYNNEAGDA